jgi:serine phosphatase RsbU (regulator of sigma subunit)
MPPGNPAARRLFATDLADVPATDWTSAFGCRLPDMVTPYPQQDMPLTRALRGEVVSNLELFMVNLWAPHGMWLSINGTPVRDARGNIEGGVVVLRDITRIKGRIQQGTADAFRGTFINRKKSGELFFTERTITPIRKAGGGITHVVSVGKDVTELRRAAARESALLLARSVQQRLFPSSQPPVPGFDICGATFVADVTGGDNYDFIPLAGECLGILVADASGHGADSALLMAETRAVLRATAQTTSEPDEILTAVNRVLHADTEAHWFATLLLVSLHVASRSPAYASAGHTPGYLLDGRGAVKAELPATGLPLGLFPGSPYETRSPLRMEEGDTLVLLTDGVTDCGTPEGELFGARRALGVARSSLAGRSSDIVEGLYRAVRAFEKGGPQRDDVTTVVVRRPPSGIAARLR